jgi:hypothetical protein
MGALTACCRLQALNLRDKGVPGTALLELGELITLKFSCCNGILSCGPAGASREGDDHSRADQACALSSHSGPLRALRRPVSTLSANAARTLPLQDERDLGEGCTSRWRSPVLRCHPHGTDSARRYAAISLQDGTCGVAARSATSAFSVRGSTLPLRDYGQPAHHSLICAISRSASGVEEERRRHSVQSMIACGQ